VSERFFAVVVLLLLAACSPQPNPTRTQPAPSPWGVPQTVGEAWRREPPALLVVEGTAYFAWSNGARHYLRVGEATPLELPLRGSMPYAHSLLPLGEDLLLLWLDADQESQRTELWGALLSRAGGVQSPPLPISAEGAQRYSAALTENDAVQVIWSSQPGAVSRLRTTTINRNGVPMPPVTLRTGADHPALVRDVFGTLRLFWMQGDVVYSSDLGEEAGFATLDDPQPLTRLPHLGAGAALDSFFVALDGTHAHLFWNTRSAGGRRTVLASVGQLNEWDFGVPSAFSIQLAQGIFVEPIRFARPLVGQHLALPVVLTTPQELGVATFRAGSLESYEALLPAPLLLAPPTLDRDAQGQVTLAWAEALPGQPARLTSLRSP